MLDAMALYARLTKEILLGEGTFCKGWWLDGEVLVFPGRLRWRRGGLGLTAANGGKAGPEKRAEKQQGRAQHDGGPEVALPWEGCGTMEEKDEEEGRGQWATEGFERRGACLLAIPGLAQCAALPRVPL